MLAPIHIENVSLSLTLFRDFSVQRALLLPNLVPRERTVHDLLSVTSQSAPPVAEASTVLVLDSQSLLEVAKGVSTVDWEPSLLYDEAVSV